MGDPRRGNAVGARRRRHPRRPRRSVLGGPRQALIALAVVLLAPACSTLPLDAPANTPSFGSEPLERGVLAEVSRKVRVRGEGADVSGFRVLDRNDESFLWRLALVDSAEQSLDAQYFIWMNLDRRSIYLNTELGLLIEHEGLADEIEAIFERLVEPANGWQVLLEDGALRWSSSKGVVRRQPARGVWQRIEDGFFSLLPLKSQL